MTRKHSLLFLLLLTSFVCLNTATLAQPRPSNIDSLLDPIFATHYFQEVAISPDGKRVAWVQTEVADGRRYKSEAYICPVDGKAAPKRLEVPDGTDQYGVAWSPDGKRLAFVLATPDAGSASLAISDPDGGKVRILATLSGSLSSVRWSPGGQHIAMLQALATRSPQHKEALHTTMEAPQPHQRIIVVDAGSGASRFLTPPELFIYEYDWAPDSRSIAATAALAGSDDRWWTAKLYRINVDSGRATVLYQPELQIAYPKWSPDGTSIAFIGGIMSDFIAPGGDAYVLEVVNRQVHNITPDLKSSVTWLGWTGEGELLTAEIADGDGAIAAWNPQTKDRRLIWKGADAPFASEVAFQPFGFSLSIAKDGRISAGVRTSFDRAPEVWAGPVGAWRQISHTNRNAQRTWGKAESIHWTSGTLRIQGWLLYPLEYDPQRKYPLVTLVHGGPAGASLAHWAVPFDDVEVLSQLGYFVFYPNPRGSLGEGEDFTRGNVRDFGYGDLHDIESGVREILHRFPVDPDRIGITGWSYGGYMAMWAITQTELFKASVAGPGISDWVSYYGQVDIQQWMLPYFRVSAYDDPAIYARSSPVNFVRKAHAATLMYVGRQDSVCPEEQSIELWRALKRLGIETELLLYPDEGHGITQPKDQRDVTRETIRWFEDHLK